MFENLKNIFKKNKKKEIAKANSKDAAKERLHLVLMQDRANVSADFLDLMRGEIIEVIKKYIDIDEDAMDVRLTTETNEDGIQGVPALYANIPIINIKDEARNIKKQDNESKIKIEPPNTEENEEKIQQTESIESNENEESIKNEIKEEVIEAEKENEEKKEEAIKDKISTETVKENDNSLEKENNVEESTNKTDEKIDFPKN